MSVYQTRPTIATIQTMLSSSEAEKYQNEVLRPVIKMKHELFIAHVRDYLMAKKYPLQGLSKAQQIAYLETAFQQDRNLRSELRGMVLGQVTLQEYERYAAHKNEINKRIINIIKTRMVDHLDVFTTSDQNDI